jgi:nucleotide-binding universal stress UspA family protein
MSEIIIGVDGTERGEDAVAFGRRLAAFAGARVVLANAFPFDDIRGRATSLAYREALREESQAMLVAVRDRYGLDASTRPIAGTSPARALHELAEHDGAALVVVGSSHVGRARRVLPGSTGERLLHGSPCAVAVVPNGYRETEHGAPRRIGVGIDGTEVAADALRGAAELARSLGAELEVIWAFAPKVAPVDEQFLADVEREWRARVNETLKAVPPAAGRGPRVRRGRPGGRARRALTRARPARDRLARLRSAALGAAGRRLRSRHPRRGVPRHRGAARRPGPARGAPRHVRGQPRRTRSALRITATSMPS